MRIPAFFTCLLTIVITFHAVSGLKCYVCSTFPDCGANGILNKKKPLLKECKVGPKETPVCASIFDEHLYKKSEGYSYGCHSDKSLPCTKGKVIKGLGECQYKCNKDACNDRPY